MIPCFGLYIRVAGGAKAQARCWSRAASGKEKEVSRSGAYRKVGLKDRRCRARQSGGNLVPQVEATEGPRLSGNRVELVQVPDSLTRAPFLLVPILS